MNHKSKGFTIIELMLSMTFLSMLLLGIALLIVQITNIYTKGVTLKEVNQAGTSLSSEIQRTLNQSSPEYQALPTQGRICTGTVSFIWNTGSKINDGSGLNKYAALSEPEASDIRFVRIVDKDRSYCKPLPSGGYPPLSEPDATELLPAGDRNLAIHSLEVSRTDVGSTQTISAISMVVGTNNGNDFISGPKECNGPADLNGYDEFCAVNIFEFTARSGGLEESSGGGGR